MLHLRNVQFLHPVHGIATKHTSHKHVTIDECLLLNPRKLQRCHHVELDECSILTPCTLLSDTTYYFTSLDMYYVINDQILAQVLNKMFLSKEQH